MSVNAIPVWEKLNLTVTEASELSNIGQNRILEMLNEPSCTFVLTVGKRKRLVKRKDFEEFLENIDHV